MLTRVDLNRVVDDYVLYKIDFIDALMVNMMDYHGIDTVYSFDRKHLNRMTRVTRLEP